MHGLPGKWHCGKQRLKTSCASEAYRVFCFDFINSIPNVKLTPGMNGLKIIAKYTQKMSGFLFYHGTTHQFLTL